MKTSAPPAAPDQDPFGLAFVIGLTQFVFLALGLMILTILVKVSTISREITPLAGFLTSHGLGLAMIPLVWALFAAVFTQRGPVAGKCATVSGIILAVAIAVVFTIAILRPAT